jgi:hypothetical protein
MTEYREEMRDEATENLLRQFLKIANLACISIPILLTLILWRVW